MHVNNKKENHRVVKPEANQDRNKASREANNQVKLSKLERS